MVEVIGMVSNKGEIMASTYNMLREDKGILFGGSQSHFMNRCSGCNTAAMINALPVCPADIELYNEALKVVHDFPQHYPFQVASSG